MALILKTNIPAMNFMEQRKMEKEKVTFLHYNMNKTLRIPC